MSLTPYLFFNGQAADAMAAYARIFGGSVGMVMTMADAPPEMDIPQDRKDWIMHGEVELPFGRIYLSDDFTGTSPAMDGCSVMVEFDTAEQARGIFEALADGGEVRMPFEPTFWSRGFGTLSDRFGTRWMVGTSESP
jgi:PhnB protein